MDINSYTWLITILVVPATGFAAAYCELYSGQES
jgi:hypothetical protein